MKIYTLKDKDKLTLTGKQLREWKDKIKKGYIKEMKEWVNWALKQRISQEWINVLNYEKHKIISLKSKCQDKSYQDYAKKRLLEINFQIKLLSKKSKEKNAS